MTLLPGALAVSAVATLSIASACVAYTLARIAPRPRPVLGTRGVQRSAALRAHASFALFEPCLRWLAAAIGRLPLVRVRRRLDAHLIEAGEIFGLDADECLALSCASGALAFGVGAWWARALDASAAWAACAAAVGAVLPLERVRGVAATRKRRIARDLPAAIDLLALCMGAGLDFAGALSLLVARPASGNSPLTAELARVLSEAALGRTRAEALSALASRVPIDAVRDFTAAVIQAELQGNPLRDAIAIQARMSRMRRSARAEQAAARASVLLAFPLLLLLGALLLLMLGPFLVNGVEL
jgi:tight adherence protein C